MVYKRKRSYRPSRRRRTTKRRRLNGATRRYRRKGKSKVLMKRLPNWFPDIANVKLRWTMTMAFEGANIARSMVIHMNALTERVSGIVTETSPVNYLNFQSIYGRVRVSAEKISFRVVPDTTADSSSSCMYMVCVAPQAQTPGVPTTGPLAWNEVSNSRYCLIKPTLMNGSGSGTASTRKAYHTVRKAYGLTKAQFMADNDYAIATTTGTIPPVDHQVEWAFYTADLRMATSGSTYGYTVSIVSTIYCIFDQIKQVTNVP